MEINAKYYKDLAEKNSIYFNEVLEALEIVKTFIKGKKLILYGGMAIHLNLTALDKEGIYEEGFIPDYDVFSSDFYNDSNELADILCKKGFKEISAINALHPTSRRVRVNFIPVADITYIPPNIYKILPTNPLTEKKYGLRVISPLFQRMDIHRAFSIPFNNSPGEVVLHRLGKDQKRFNLLHQAYPIVLPKNVIKFNKNIISIDKMIEGVIVAGYTCYNMIKQLYEILSGKSVKNPIWIYDDLLTVICEDTDKITKLNELPRVEGISPMSKHDSHQNKKIKTSKNTVKNTVVVNQYNRYLDIRPKLITVKYGEIYLEILDTNNDLVPCYPWKDIKRAVKELVYIDLPDYDGYLAQPNYILMYFLQQYFEHDNIKFLYLYNEFLTLISEIEDWYLENEEKLKPYYNELPFFMSCITYGNIVNEDNRDQRPVFGYYPKENNPGNWPEFNIKKSPLFHIDGTKIV